MKKYFLTVSFVFVTYFLSGQTNSKEYNDLIDKAESFRITKDFKKAAIAYSAAANMPGVNPDIGDWDPVACAWSLAGYPDSAFNILNTIANLNDLTFKAIEDEILTDDDYIPLHDDKRWQEVIDKMFINAYKIFLSAQKEAGGKLNTPSQNESAYALALGNNDDNAFVHLNDAAYFFHRKKQFEKAYKLFKASIDNFPPNYTLYKNMLDYYKATGDKERAYIYFSRAEVVKYKELDIFSDTTLKIDSAIKAEYQGFSNNIGHEFQAPEYLVTTIANALLKKGMADRAFTLFKLNLTNYPYSFALYDEIGNYYAKKNNKEKANEYFSKSLKMQYKLPENFFDSSFAPQEYLKSYFQNISNQKENIVLPPILMINKLYNYFFTVKSYKKAEDLIKMNVDNFPKSWDSYARISELYRTIGDSAKANQFKRQSLSIKNIYLPESRNGAAIIADSTFNTGVINPVCSNNCPTILIDEAHNNSGFTALNRYKPFATLMTNDGFKVIRSQTPFTKQLLTKTNIVVIAGPRGISETEIQVLKDWVIKGGAMLVVTDHDNSQSDGLLKSFGVETNEVSLTSDSLHGIFAKDGAISGPGYIVFREEDKLLGNHVILKGRNQTEKVSRVQTFAGRSIVGPPGSSILLQLSESSVDFMTIDADNIRSRVPVKTKGLRSHGIAFTFGKGKVVVISEAATLTAQLFSGEPYRTIDEFGKIGMNTPGSDNKQFALNIMRWLTGYLK